MNKLKNNVLLIFIILIAIVLGILTACTITFYATFQNSGEMAPRNIYKGSQYFWNDKR